MLHGNINCDYSGRKRKKKKVRGARYEKFQAKDTGTLDQPLYRHRSLDAEQYKSNMDTGHNCSKVEAQKAEGYTVAIPYNKGGYSVIPQSEVKHIGK